MVSAGTCVLFFRIFETISSVSKQLFSDKIVVLDTHIRIVIQKFPYGPFAKATWLGMHRMALPQAAVPSGENTIDLMRANSRKLVHSGLTKPSQMSIADPVALQFR